MRLAAIVRSRILTLAMAVFAVTWGVDQTFAADVKKPQPKKSQRITPADRKAAAKRAAAKGVKPGVAGIPARQECARSRVLPEGNSGPACCRGAGTMAALAAAPLPGIEGPGGVPHYFGPYGNWAYSPLPRGPVAAVTVDGRRQRVHRSLSSPSSTPTAPAHDARPPSTAPVDPVTGAITGFTIANGGADYSAPVVTIDDRHGRRRRRRRDASAAPSPAACASSSTGCRAWGRPARTPSASTSRWRIAETWPSVRAGQPARPTTTRSPSSSTPSRCTRTCRRPGSGATSSCRRPPSPAQASPLTQSRRRSILKPDGTQAIGVDEPPLPGARHRRQGAAPMAWRVRPASRYRSASSSTTCFPPAPAGTSSSRWTRPSWAPGWGRPCRARRATSTRRTEPSSTSTATTPSGSATATPTSGSRRPTRVTPYPKGVSVRNVPDMFDARQRRLRSRTRRGTAAGARPSSTPTRRAPGCSSTTTMPWASRASTCTPARRLDTCSRTPSSRT